MSIKMKTYERNNSMSEVLDYNGIKHFDNAFELVFKNVERCTKQSYDDMDFVLMKATMTPITIIKTNSSVFQSKNIIKKYIVMFENIKNEQGEYFSSFVNSLCKNDKILIIDGIILRNNTNYEKNILTVSVRVENNSSVFLFKYGNSAIKKTNLLVNLSGITGSGLYSLFGLVRKVIKYTDEEFMLLRIECHDKCVIKIHRYPHSICEIWNMFNEESETGIKYDFSSKEVDILIKNPSINFMSLVPNQQIYLKNVKASYSSVSELFSLYLKGRLQNLKANPIQTVNVNSCKPSTNFHFPVTDNLIPSNKLNTKPNLFIDSQLDDESDTHKDSNQISLPMKNSSLNIEMNEHKLVNSTNITSDDNVNVSPCKDFLASQHVNKNMNIDIDNKIKDEFNFTNIKKLKSINQSIENHDIYINSHLTNESNTHKELNQINLPIKNKSLNIEMNESVNLTNISSDDNINVTPCKVILALQLDTNKSMNNDTTVFSEKIIKNTNQNNDSNCPSRETDNINACINNQIEKSCNISEKIKNCQRENSPQNLSRNDSFSPPLLTTLSNKLTSFNTSTPSSCSPPFLTTIPNELSAVKKSNIVHLNNNKSTIPKVNKMSIKMKTYERNNSISEVLDYNGIKHFDNAFELVFKDVERCTKQSYDDMDFVLMKATMTPITIIKINTSVSLSKNIIKKYIVMFENIKNEKEEYFSSFVNRLCENDKILIVDGIILRNNTNYEKNVLTVTVRVENNSSVFLFKYGNSVIKKTNLLVNLSGITGSGLYSLFGLVRKVIKYTDEEFMLLRIECHDKCVIKIHRYPHSICEIWNMFNEESKTGMKYDYSSKKVDILIKKPSINFKSLVPHQQIHLNNIKVRCSSVSNIFSLYLKGKAKNLKADSIEIAIVNSYGSSSKLNPILPNKLEFLKPINPSKRKHDICPDDQLNSVSNKLIKTNDLTKSLNIDINEYNLTNMSTDDSINVSYNVINEEETPTHGSCLTMVSNEFLNSDLLKATSSLNVQSNKIHMSNVKSNKPTQCIGPCRLYYTEPNVYTSEDGQEFISAYCPKCYSFFMKSSLIKLNMEYGCPECSTIVNLGFFFKMYFLYGKNFNKSIEVCCFNSYAERIIKKLSKIKCLTLEKYLSCQKYRKLILSTVKSLIDDKTKINIIVCESVSDNTNLLLAMDTKYIVTNPIY